MSKKSYLLFAMAAVVAFVALVVTVSVVSARNIAIGIESDIEASHAEIQSVTQKRVDALTSLVNTVQDAKVFEGDTLEKLTKARSLASEGKIEQAQIAIQSVAEAYPQIKTIDLYQNVMQETSVVENQLRISRDAYTNSVRRYKNHTRTFPNSLYLSLASYEVKDYEMFEASEGAKSYDPSSENLWEKK